MVLGVHLLLIFVDSKTLLPDVAMMNLSGTPCFESRCIPLSLNGLYRRRQTPPSTARRLQDFASLQNSKLAFSTLPCSILSVTDTFWCSCLFSGMIFHMERSFFLSASLSLVISSSFLFLSVVHACASCRAHKIMILPAAIGHGR